MAQRFFGFSGLWLVLGLVILGAPERGDAVVITEIMALNLETLQDEDGDTSDWLELFNEDDSIVSLEGWYLSDDPRDPARWTLPDIDLYPGDFLLVFCSGKNRRLAGGELHTNFRLRDTGEYLGLLRPDGTVEAQFSPMFPPQVADVSYGFPQESLEISLVSEGASAKVLVPVDESLGRDWLEPDFDDNTWLDASTAIGFDQKSIPTFDDLIQTDIADIMRRVNASVYVRIPFEIADPGRHGALQLSMRYEDGFVAHVNGVEVASGMAPETLAFDSTATDGRLTSDARTAEVFTIRSVRDHLIAGTNILAIQGLNNSASGSDFFVLPEMVGVVVQGLDPRSPRFYDVPTPEWPNGPGFVGIAAQPEASRATGVFTDDFSVELSLQAASGQIRFTRDGTDPTVDSELYTGPIPIAETTRLRVKSFVDGLLPSRNLSLTYLELTADVADFNSDVPLLVFDTFGETIGADPKIAAHIHIVDADDALGRSALLAEPHFSGDCGIEARGSSSLGRVKRSYSFEFWDENRADRAVSLLGFPTESDWVLYGPYECDFALLRTSLIYELSNQIGRYAVRTRFCEVLVNLDGGAVSSADYFGVYLLMEKVKRGPHRVNVEPLMPEHDTEPSISGGYILKIDRPGDGDLGFVAARQELRYVDPREEDITSAQATWIKRYMDDFGDALFGGNFTDPLVGYAKYVNVGSAFDHHLLNEFAKNPDGFYLSTFMFKPRGRRLHMGPLWDFDRTMGADCDPRSFSPVDWSGPRLHNWWGRFFLDPAFERGYRLRWQTLRSGPMATENIIAVVDSQAAELEEAQERNFARWSSLVDGLNTWRNEVEQLRDWIRRRVEWMDAELSFAPVFSSRGGRITPPFEVTLAHLNDTGNIVYTINGPDPRQESGGTAPAALVYSGETLVLTGNSRIRARVRFGSTSWSRLSAEVYVAETPKFALTELMYRPTGGSAFEFLEIYNFGKEPELLRGASFTQGVDVKLEGDPEYLGPGEYALVVNSLSDFESRHDTRDMLIAGEYGGSLSDAGETLAFVGPLGEAVFEFRYEDGWHPASDADGHSLVLIDPTSPPETWGGNDGAAWRSSQHPGGSPGVEDPGNPSRSGQIPGDSNQDGRLNISDALHLVQYLFTGPANSLPCETGSPTDVANILLLDTNDDASISASDAVYNLLYLFLFGPPPAKGTACVEITGCPPVCAP